MKPNRRRYIPLLLCAVLVGVRVPAAAAQTPDIDHPTRYLKQEHFIAMRDGVRLHTSVYIPRDASEEKKYPFLMVRTPYNCKPYGEARFPGRIGPSPFLEETGYIFVCQDVRGRWMSEGSYDNMRPHVPGELPIDESSDTFDTIEWLLENIPHHNGRVGQWGISYPGFYTAAALAESHPALKASSPQAPIADFYFDDFHHMGAYTLGYWMVTPLFGIQKEEPTSDRWYEFPDPGTPDGYRFFMELGPLKNSDRYFGEDNFFWEQLTEHPNYDAFWQARNILPHLDDVGHAVMTVGGWFDAEDLYGPLNIYQTIERHSPETFNALVMGPWSHGDWARDRPVQMVGPIDFGERISLFYQREVEKPFFEHFLKDVGAPPAFEALVFDTGVKEWHRFADWPPDTVRRTRFYLREDEVLSTDAPQAGETAFTEYVSDPDEPVPYTDATRITFTPRAYMAEDQRFASRRPDVIEFETEVLTEPVTFAGDLLAHLLVSTTATDADFVVKLVDVYPPGMEDTEHTPEHVRLGGYEQMVRSDIIRGRFRNSFEHPEPFEPNRITEVELPLQDVFHTFRPGHRIMIQIQSTWFPLFDRNPQRYVPNIFEADEADFIEATHRIYHDPNHASYIEASVM